MRTFKVFGVAFVAALALAGLAAASAFANYDSSAEVTELSGTQTVANVFTTNKGTVKCEVAKFAGTQKGTEIEPGVFTSKTITVHPTYEKCRAFGLAATVTTTGCDYEFNEATVAAEPSASVNIKCNTGSEIVVNGGFGSCIVHVAGAPQNQNLEHVLFTNNAGGTVTVKAEVSGIQYSSEGICGAESAANGTYTGSVLTEGLNGASIKVT